MTASIIILTYNSEKYIEKLLSSLKKVYKGQILKNQLEIIVADNSSSDNTVKIIKSIENIKVLENGGNYGFAKGNNLAASIAKGDYLIFINPDAEFLKGDLFNMLDSFENENIGIIGGEIVDFKNKRELSCGKFYSVKNIFLLSLGLEEKMGVRFAPNKKTEVNFVSGAFLSIRKKLFVKLKGFDENYFMYIEDQDLCFRAYEKGYKILFSNAATIRHLGQGSSNRAFAVINIYKGLIYFQKKHMGFFSYHLSKIVLFIKAFVLVSIGTVTRNEYLTDTYRKALKYV